MKRLRNLSFKYRILFGCLIVALVPLLVCNVLMLEILRTSLQNQATERAEHYLGEMRQKLEEVFAACELACGNVAEDSFLSWSLIDNSLPKSDVYLALYKAGSGLPAGADLSIYDVGGMLRHTTNDSTALPSLNVRWGVLRKAYSASGMVYYDIEAFFGERQPYAMHTARRIHTQGGALLGYVVISIPADTLQSQFTGLFDSTSTFLLLDTAGVTVYSSQPAFTATKLAALRSALIEGEPEIVERGDDLFYISRLEQSGFYIVLWQSKTFTGDTLGTMQNVSVLTALLCFALCLAFSAMISRGLSRPVSRLTLAMERIKQGELDIRVETKSGDELGRLAHSFNLMAADLRQYMDKAILHQQEKNETQIRLLQAQLNPHFLYNTLDTIKWVAKINDIPEIASISSNLAVILRECVSSAQFVTLRRECDVVQSYIDIQRIRFSGRFKYVLSLPPELENCLIPKLILQPIVENAILHGLKDKESGYIYICVIAEDEKTLLITVTDDGCGMSPEETERLKTTDGKMVEGHLGLYNVSRIIKINYGEEYGVSAKSMENVGTTLSIRLPLARG